MRVQDEGRVFGSSQMETLYKQFSGQYVAVHYRIGEGTGMVRGVLSMKLDGFWVIRPDPDIEGVKAIKSTSVDASLIYKIDEVDRDVFLKEIQEQRADKQRQQVMLQQIAAAAEAQQREQDTGIAAPPAGLYVPPQPGDGN